MEDKKSWTVVQFKEDNSVADLLTSWIISPTKCLWPPYSAPKVTSAIRTLEVNTHWSSHQIKVLRNAPYADVPTSWIISPTKCLWPPYSAPKVTSAIRTLEVNTHWSSYQIKVLRNAPYERYEIARSKAVFAEDTGDFNSDSELNKKRKRMRIVYSFPESPDNGSSKVSFMKPPQYKIKETLKKKLQLETTPEIPKVQEHFMPKTTVVPSENIVITVEPHLFSPQPGPSTSKTVDTFSSKPGLNASTMGLTEKCGCCVRHAGYINNLVREQRRIRNVLADLPESILNVLREHQLRKSPIKQKNF